MAGKKIFTMEEIEEVYRKMKRHGPMHERDVREILRSLRAEKKNKGIVIKYTNSSA